MARCRSCGKELVVSEHVTEHSYSYISEGSTKWASYNDYSHPCPYCGDNKPLALWHNKRNVIIAAISSAVAYYFWEGARGAYGSPAVIGWGTALLFASVIAVGFWIIFLFNEIRYRL
ncbi:hypothetical protein JCM15519_20830 [Fundidesulfovibrio butyratiphilus]